MSMSTHDHDEHEHGSELSETQLRVRALETILTEKGYVDPAVLDLIVEHYETKTGPHVGARVIAKAWVDPEFKRALGLTGPPPGEAQPSVPRAQAAARGSAYVVSLPPRRYVDFLWHRQAISVDVRTSRFLHVGHQRRVDFCAGRSNKLGDRH